MQPQLRLLFHRPVRPRRDERCLILDLEHNSARTVAISLRFHTDRRADPYRDPSAGRMVMLLYPRIRARVAIDLSHLERAVTHMPRRPGVGICVNSGPVVKVLDLVSVTGLVDHPPKGFRLRVREFKLQEEVETGRVISPKRPLVDRLGQDAHRTWPGKSKVIRPAEPAPLPPAGLTVLAPRRRADPSFRIDQEHGRLWLIAPSGERIFSTGVNCVVPHAGGPVAGMERLFTSLKKDPNSREASFYTENLKRRYGEAWQRRWARLAVDRLLGWGFNTIGNWSDPSVWAERRMYYTINAAWWDEVDEGLYGRFPDVFDPAFSRRCDSRARERCRPDDPFLIGYFVNNEPRWQRTDLHLAELALRTDRAPFTKRFLINWLRKKYGSGSARPSSADLDRMRELMVDRYLDLACGALKRFDPHHLTLGIRFYGVPPKFLLGAMRHTDVVTVNTYEIRPNSSIMRTLHRETGKPVMIGEFHFGATDRGPTYHGLVGVPNQKERAIAYGHYMERAAADPACVGAHWFQHVDQPLLGRFDGENYGVGFVDVTDRPYPELVAAARSVNPRLAAIHAGRGRPQVRAPRLEPNGLIW